jgi:septum formation protein
VQFGKLDQEEIEYYITQFHPFDKAGGYGAQDFIGYIGIIDMKGSYYNVMGFPLHLVYACLKYW